MKQSGIIGVLAAALLVYSCTRTWITVPAHDILVSGFRSENFDLFGRPGILHAVFASLATILFIIPRLWAKRVNVFICAVNLAWAIANFYRIGVVCRAGDCPQKYPGIYLILIASLLMFIMSLLPRINVQPKSK